MTTLVVVRKNSEVAIAADSLTTFGDTRLSAEFDRTYDKIVRYRDTYVGLCGSAAHQLVFQSILARHEDLDFSTKAAIFETFRKLHPILKDQHFLNPKEEEDDPYESTQITALVANGRGIFGVYSMREVFEYTRFWAAGTGREFAFVRVQHIAVFIDDVVAILVGLAVSDSGLHSAASHPNAEAARMMVAPETCLCDFALAIGGAPELPAPDHQRIVQQTALFKVHD